MFSDLSHWCLSESHLSWKCHQSLKKKTFMRAVVSDIGYDDVYSIIACSKCQDETV